MKRLPLNSGEVFYLRLLLLHTKPFRWGDAKKVGDITYDTFQQAAIAAGLITNQTAAMEAFQQHLTDEGILPNALRGLFATMTLEGFPTICIFEDDDLRRRMMADYLHRGMSFSMATNELLKDLAYKYGSLYIHII
jgi:hypothetical protein